MAETLGSDSPLLKSLISVPHSSAPMAFLRRRRRWILLFSAAGVGTYGAYRLYNLPSVVRKRRRLARIFEALVSLAEAISSSADTVALVSSDLNRFLRSESDEIPASLKQIWKIARSDEFAASLSRVSEALTVGIVRGVGSSERPASPDLTDRILEKLFSDSGSGFASIVVGRFARNLVIGFYASGSGQGSSSESLPSWIQLISRDDKCKELLARCIQSFVSSAVAVYLDKTMDINTYDEFFAGITNPKNEDKMKELVSFVCNGAVETLIRTSHEVLTSSSSSSSTNGVEFGQKRNENDERRSFGAKENEGGGGWIHQVSSSLAVPSNRSFVLDVTGRVTFETVRSFLEFLLWKLCDGAKRSFHCVREGVVEKGVEVVRYFSAKSMLVVTICLALCMRVLAGTRVLMPA